MRFPLASLRSRAIGLVLLAILPLLALTFSSYLDQRDREIREVQQDALTAAKNLAVIQETLISGTKRLLMTLSRMPEVQKFDRAGGNALFAMMMEENPYLNDIIAVNLQGRLFASAPPAHAPLNYSDRLWFKKVLETKTFSTGELVKGRLSGRYTLGLAYPIANRQGDLQGVVRAGTNLEWWGNLLTQMGFTPDTAVVFSDSSQKVLFRYPDPEKYLGQMLPEALRKAMAVSNAGVAEGVGLPGDPRLFAFARLAPPWQDMWVSIGLPKDVAVGPAKRALKQNLVFLFLVAFLALAAAWYFGEFFVIRPVRGLLGVTKRLAAGDLTVRAGAAYQKGELGLLASSFDQMAASLQKRDTALEEQHEPRFAGRRVPQRAARHRPGLLRGHAHSLARTGCRGNHRSLPPHAGDRRTVFLAAVRQPARRRGNRRILRVGTPTLDAAGRATRRHLLLLRFHAACVRPRRCCRAGSAPNSARSISTKRVVVWQLGTGIEMLELGNRSDLYGYAQIEAKGLSRLSEIEEFYELRTLDGAIVAFRRLAIVPHLGELKFWERELKHHTRDGSEIFGVFSPDAVWHAAPKAWNECWESSVTHRAQAGRGGLAPIK